MTRPFYSYTLLFHPLPTVNAVSIFRNDKKHICSPRRECLLPTGQFQLFLSCGFVIALGRNAQTRVSIRGQKSG